MKNVREYVRWMMYWVVYAIFISAEMFADMLLGFWFPFYYELKIIFLIWLLSPTTKGSSFLYRKFVHPWLAKHEKDIDSYIEQAKESGYHTFLRVSRNSLAVAADTMVKTAVTSQTVIAEKLRQYGTESADGPPSDRLHKSKSWSSGMNVPDNDFETIQESEEEKTEFSSDGTADPDAESAKLQGELNELNEKESTNGRSKRSAPSYSSATLPRSFGRAKSQSTRSLYTPSYEPYGSGMSSSAYSASSSSVYPGASYSTSGFESGATTRSRSRKKIT